jgi:hypothetical protein
MQYAALLGSGRENEACGGPYFRSVKMIISFRSRFSTIPIPNGMDLFVFNLQIKLMHA